MERPSKTLKRIDFFNTFRFRIVAWYFSVTLLLVCIMIVGINSAMTLTEVDTPVPFALDSKAWNEKLAEQREEYIEDLRMYSIIGAAWVLVVGSVGVFALSKELFKPIDDVTLLASRISNTNLAERINYKGANDEIKRMADTFDDMLGRLEESFKQQKEFSQNAAHELRTPIAIALTNIEVMEMDETPTIEEYQQLIKTIKSSLERMNNVNNNLQILSEGNKPNIINTPININDVLSEIIRETENTINQANLTLSCNLSETPLIINGDIMGIKQCFFNLIENAIKYNVDGGSILIKSSNANHCAVIDIADTGIGIPESQIPYIFQRFYRVDKSRSRKMGGSGLGLTIVEKIIVNHGGQISVQSKEGSGTAFHIMLPLAIQQPETDIKL